jgi:hypothetical protein
MESNRGWAKDFGKRRYDATVQEIDLLRMLAERGVDPVATSARMTTWDVQMIMDHEASAFMHWSLGKEPDEPSETHRATAAAHLAARNKLLDKYAPRLVAEEAQAEQPAF